MRPNSGSILAAGILTLGALLGMATTPASAQVLGGAATPPPNPYPSYTIPRTGAAPMTAPFPAPAAPGTGTVQAAAYSAVPGITASPVRAGATIAAPYSPGPPAPAPVAYPMSSPTIRTGAVGYPVANRPEPLYPVPPKLTGWDRFFSLFGMAKDSNDADGHRAPRDPSTGTNVNSMSKPWLTPLR